MKQQKNIRSEKKNNLHPRNKNNIRYDFQSLIKLYPELKQFVFTNRYKHETVDFANPDAVRVLNKVLLQHFYGLSYWDIPKNYLCPPIPGRADYIHHVADLLASCNNNIIPQGNSITALDIGVGANCIYPIIGNKEYGWRFICSDVDPIAIESAKKIVHSNHFPDESIEIRRQGNLNQMFQGIVTSDDQFDVTMCNPPFHSTMGQAMSGTLRKWKNVTPKKMPSTALNFGGQSHELIFPGGEEAFITSMIQESVQFAKQIFWFTSLVSKQSNLSKINKSFKMVVPVEVRTVEMAQGQKKSRFVAWTFLTNDEQQQWQREKWNIQHTLPQ
ncbi:MAG: 23S rRNA (adenine(1618)-N(6))-methyltransferase RlmF [Bacteroidota bacterium]